MSMKMQGDLSAKAVFTSKGNATLRPVDLSACTNGKSAYCIVSFENPCSILSFVGLKAGRQLCGYLIVFKWFAG